MQTARIVETIATPIEPTWAAIDDFGAIDAFHPELTESRTLGEQETGEGAERLCRFKNGAEIREKVTRYKEGSGYTVTITDTGSFPIEAGLARLYLRPTEDGRTEVDFALDFQPKFGFVGEILGRVAMKPQFERILRRVVRGLEEHVATTASAAAPTPSGHHPIATQTPMSQTS